MKHKSDMNSHELSLLACSLKYCKQETMSSASLVRAAKCRHTSFESMLSKVQDNKLKINEEASRGGVGWGRSRGKRTNAEEGT